MSWSRVEFRAKSIIHVEVPKNKLRPAWGLTFWISLNLIGTTWTERELLGFTVFGQKKMWCLPASLKSATPRDAIKAIGENLPALSRVPPHNLALSLATTDHGFSAALKHHAHHPHQRREDAGRRRLGISV